MIFASRQPHRRRDQNMNIYYGPVPSMDDDDRFLLKWDNPWLLSISTTCLLLVPMLIMATLMAFSMTGRSWTCSLFSIHLMLSLVSARILMISRGYPLSHSQKILTSVSALCDLVLIHFVYIQVWRHFIGFFFTDIDGTSVTEWKSHKRGLILLTWLGKIVILSRIFVGGSCILCRFSLVGTQFLVETENISNWWNDRIPSSRKRNLALKVGTIFLTISIIASTIWSCICLLSIIAHFTSFQVRENKNEYCDPLDTTECSLPFPSFHHCIRDSSAVTGWRVNLRGESFPFLRGGLYMQADFANELDGFSTMAPMLFYLDGLKEAHELDSSNAFGLQGPESIAKSITPYSITLLLNVNTSELVPHTAEIDHLDPHRPMVMVFPAQPLRHATHYALAVVNATNVRRERIPPTPGMKALLRDNSTINGDIERFWRYKNVLIPALEEAADWFSFSKDPDSLQLMFDFTTVSAKSQLGPIRSVRDRTLEILESDSWGAWDNHIKILTMEKKDCSKQGILMSRIYHASLEVPWFLESFGRDALLNKELLSVNVEHIKKGHVKFTLQVPCSVHQHALNARSGMPLRAIVEYGHGLFYNRDEAFSHALQR